MCNVDVLLRRNSLYEKINLKSKQQNHSVAVLNILNEIKTNVCSVEHKPLDMSESIVI